MFKKRIKIPISTKLPLLKITGEPFKPDFIMVVKDGKVRTVGLDPTTDLRPLMYQLRDILDQIDDIQWSKNGKK